MTTPTPAEIAEKICTKIITFRCMGDGQFESMVAYVLPLIESALAEARRDGVNEGIDLAKREVVKTLKNGVDQYNQGWNGGLITMSKILQAIRRQLEGGEGNPSNKHK